MLGNDGQPIVLYQTEGKVSIAPPAWSRSTAGRRARVALRSATRFASAGDNYVTGTVRPRASRSAPIAQGSLETSNVNTVEEMVALIENMREFEADQKVIRAMDDTLGGAVNQVGRVE